MFVGVIWKRSSVFFCFADKDAYCAGSYKYFWLVANVKTLHNTNGISCNCCLRMAVKLSEKVLIQTECCRTDFGGEFCRQNDTSCLLWVLMRQGSFFNAISDLRLRPSVRLLIQHLQLLGILQRYRRLRSSDKWHWVNGKFFRDVSWRVTDLNFQGSTMRPPLLETLGNIYRLTRYIWQEWELIQHFCFLAHCNVFRIE